MKKVVLAGVTFIKDMEGNVLKLKARQIITPSSTDEKKVKLILKTIAKFHDIRTNLFFCQHIK